MRACVFIGPTIPAAEARKLLDAEYRPPAAQGDVYLAARARPQAIGIVDGYFERVPAVWHKEILWAMARGIHVFGSSSMGALRAAELWPFGMEGVGRIFAWYRDGALEDDDEVALVHGPAESGYVAASEPMVNIRATLESAERAGIVSAATAVRLSGIAKELDYWQRTYAAVLARARERGAPGPELATFERWLPGGRVDQKRLDAVNLLSALRTRLAADPAPKQVTFFFERTVFWGRLERSMLAREHGSESRVELTTLLDELRLDPVAYVRARDAALLRELALTAAERAGVTAADGAAADLLAEFRARYQLSGDDDLQRWLRENDLSAAELDELLREEATLAAYRAQMGLASLRRLPDHLRLTGTFAAVLGRARRRRALLAEHGLERPKPEDLSMTVEEVVESYIEDLVTSEEGVGAAEYAAALRSVSRDLPGLLRAALAELCARRLAASDAEPGDDRTDGTHAAQGVDSAAAFPYPEGLRMLPTDVVARYADPAIDPGHRTQRAHMQGLTDAIARDGVLEPLIIKVEDGRAHIFDGNHRLAVAQRLGIPALPVYVHYDGPGRPLPPPSRRR